MIHHPAARAGRCGPVLLLCLCQEKDGSRAQFSFAPFATFETGFVFAFFFFFFPETREWELRSHKVSRCVFCTLHARPRCYFRTCSRWNRLNTLRHVFPFLWNPHSGEKTPDLDVIENWLKNKHFITYLWITGISQSNNIFLGTGEH